MTHEVFISYHSSQRAYATQLRDALQKLGFDPWLDANINARTRWNDEIKTQLANAKCIVVLWSHYAVSSEWVRHEASTAVARDCYIPCRIESVLIEGPLNDFQSIDLVGWDGSSGTARFPDLVSAIEKCVGRRRDVDVILATSFKPWPRKAPISSWDASFAMGFRLAQLTLLTVAFVLLLAVYLRARERSLAESELKNVFLQIQQSTDRQSWATTEMKVRLERLEASLEQPGK